jgi:hypothetical protein
VGASIRVFERKFPLSLKKYPKISKSVTFYKVTKLVKKQCNILKKCKVIKLCNEWTNVHKQWTIKLLVLQRKITNTAKIRQKMKIQRSALKNIVEIKTAYLLQQRTLTHIGTHEYEVLVKN